MTFKDQKNQIKLSSDEKNQIYWSIRLRNQILSSKRRSVSSFSFFAAHPMFRIVGAVVLVFFTLGGTVSAFAEQAIPGETFYNVKTNVNERVVNAFKLTTEAKTAHETQLIERRFEEVKKVLEKESISNDQKAELVSSLQDDVKKHKDRVVKNVSILREEGKSGKALTLLSEAEKVIEVKSNSISSDGENSDDQNIVEIVDGFKKSMAEVSTEAVEESNNIVSEIKTGDSIKIEEDLSAIQEKLSSTFSDFSRLYYLPKTQSSIDPEFEESIDLLFEEARDLANKADELYQDSEINDAIDMYKQAFDIISKALISLETEMDNINSKPKAPKEEIEEVVGEEEVIEETPVEIVEPAVDEKPEENNITEIPKEASVINSQTVDTRNASIN